MFIHSRGNQSCLRNLHLNRFSKNMSEHTFDLLSQHLKRNRFLIKRIVNFRKCTSVVIEELRILH